MYPNDRILSHRPPRIAMSLVALAVLFHYTIPLEWHRSLVLPAAITGLAGILIMLRAWWLFKIANTDICPTANTTTLITHDIYAATRNPMYLGMTLMLLGLALFAGSLPFYIATLANFAIINQHFCPYEEDKLRRQFPGEYADYANRVRRWI